MASGVIKKSSNRQIKYFDVVVPAGSASYNFASQVPSDYNATTRLNAMSVGGAGAFITQLGGTSMFFSAALGSSSTIRILYFVD